MKVFIKEENLLFFVEEFVAEVDYDIAKELDNEPEWKEELMELAESLAEKYLFCVQGE